MSLIFVTNWQPVGFMTLYSDEEYVARLEKVIDLIKQSQIDGGKAYYHLFYQPDLHVQIMGVDTPYLPDTDDHFHETIDRMLREYSEMP